MQNITILIYISAKRCH